MARLTLNLFGRPAIQLNKEPLTRLNSKAEALVYYLAATRQAASRELLAGLLWSDFSEKRARGNLRVELGKLRPRLGEHLHIQRQTVAFAFVSDHDIDVVRFEELLNRPSPTAEQIEEAAVLYKGDFLADFALKGAPLFEEWQLIQQERLRQTMLGALQRLSAGYGQQKLYDEAITAARRLLEIEPWAEAGHQALMRWYALSGQKLSALSQYDQCREILWSELAEEPNDGTELIYNQILTGELVEDPDGATMQIAVRQSGPAPFQPLPPSQTFVGREAEIGRLREIFNQENGPHLVALVGMGGIGKTTIANRISHALRDEFPDGMLWANAVTTEPLDILQSWGQAYGFDYSGISDLNNRAAAVRGMLADKKVLVVLDDIVQVSRIRPLLPNGEKCAVILTTRDLDVATVLNAEVIRVDELSLENGLQMLREILGGDRVNREQEAAEGICRQLQLHPLAMEITAMRLKSRQRRTLTSMADRLGKMEQRMGLELKDRAVRASFEVSWGALTQELKDVFARLAVFDERPFTPAAVAYVLDEDEYDTEDYLFTLSALSLIKEEGEIRFRLHPLLADFAEEKIGAEKSESNGRMATFYHDFAAEHQDNYDQLSLEWSNMLSGMRAAHDEKLWKLVLQYAHTLVNHWFNQNRITDIVQGMLWGETAAGALGNTAEEAFMLMKLGQASLTQSDHNQAKSCLEQSLRLFNQLGDLPKVAEVQFNLARVAREQNQLEEALDLLEESMQISKSHNDQIGYAKALYRQARIWSVFGPDYPKAIALAQEARQLLANHQIHFWHSNTLRLLAEIALKQGELETAEKLCVEAEELNQMVQDLGELGAVNYLWLSICHKQKKIQDAKQYAQKALHSFKQMGNLRFEGLVLCELGHTLKDAKETAEAKPILEKCLALYTSLNDQIGMVYACALLGDCYQIEGDMETAARYWIKAKDIVIYVSNANLQNGIARRIASLEK